MVETRGFTLEEIAIAFEGPQDRLIDADLAQIHSEGTVGSSTRMGDAEMK